jgi:acyl-CoA synthetase (AMP-forming)/AMP-acid ligase II
MLLRDAETPARLVAERNRIPQIELISHNGKLDLHLVIPQMGQSVAPEEPIADTPAFILSRRQAAPSQRGEIWVRGPTVMSGYLNEPELNRAAFVDDWFRTGDIGSMDNDGFLTLHGREKELINRGGEKIAPIEIDNALMRHPAVVEAAAYAVHHSRLGEDVAAAVVLRPGSTLTGDQLRKFLSTQLPWFKVPRRIDFHDQLPKGPTGKIQRQKLGNSSS